MNARVVAMLRLALPACVLAGAAACGRDGAARASLVVERYNARLAEAYRTADPSLLDGVAGEEEARRVATLIDVKLDGKVTLDAELAAFRVAGVEARDGGYDVTTEERWRYRDRRVGSGEVVGAPSEDSYRMRYRVALSGDRWVVTGAAFAEPPRVGRSVEPGRASARMLHGFGADDGPDASGGPAP